MIDNIVNVVNVWSVFFWDEFQYNFNIDDYFLMS